MFMLEFTRMLAIDVSLLISLIVLARLGLFSRRLSLLIRTGIVLLLAEDAVRWGIGAAIGFVSMESQAKLDLIRQLISFVGATGAVLVCIALFAFLAHGRRLCKPDIRASLS
jgi:hypothetical protein